MPAPISGYVNASGSLFRINGEIIDLELITEIGAFPPNVYSLNPISFYMRLDGRDKTITNSQAANSLNIQNYYVSGTYNYISASTDLYNNFKTQYHQITSSVLNIKGYIN